MFVFDPPLFGLSPVVDIFYFILYNKMSKKVPKEKKLTKKEEERLKLEKGILTCEHKINEKALVTTCTSKKKFVDDELVKLILQKCKLDEVTAEKDTHISRLIQEFDGECLENESLTITIKDSTHDIVVKKVTKRVYEDINTIEKFIAEAQTEEVK
jgi:hypothetical protein